MEEIFKQYYAALCLFAKRLVENDLLAEDIVQEVFIRFEEEREQKNIRQYYRAWLYTAVKNACLNAIREKKRAENNNTFYVYNLQTGEDNKEPDIEHLIIRTETTRQLWLEVQKLPAQMQQVIRMHFIENRSVRDIAQVLHLHISTVKTQKLRGLALLPSLYHYCFFIFLKIFFKFL